MRVARLALLAPLALRASTAALCDDSAEVLDAPACPEPPTADDVVRVAVCFDRRMVFEFEGAPFATFARALGASNRGAPMVVHALNAGLSAAQRCLVRAALLAQLAPRSRAHTVSVDHILADAGITTPQAHVTPVAMSRLFLPSLRPCVAKVIWFDLDLLVLRPLAPLWRVAPSAPCGIAARPSINAGGASYVAHAVKGPAEYVKRTRKRYERTPGFNDGVMVVDLDAVRAHPTFERTVRESALEFGNNDQTVLNIFCDGAFSSLDPNWNVLYSSPWAALNVNQSDWRILHFVGSAKPWLPGMKWPIKQARVLWDQYRLTLEGALAAFERGAVRDSVT